MTEGARRVWRAAPATLTAAVVFTVVAVAAVLALAVLIHQRAESPWIPAGLAALAVLALLYTWRFALHPRLRADADGVEVRNPFSRRRFAWSDITVVAPGENGLLVASEDGVAEAWCVQKSNWSLRRGRFTRADAVAHELIDLLEVREPPLQDEETGLRIRRARPDEARTLTRLERAASEEALEHLFPPEQHPYPVTAVTSRWRRLLRDPSARVFVLDREDTPLGYLAFRSPEVLHLGVAPHRTRLGYGSALLQFACREIFDGGAGQAEAWVLAGDAGALAFLHEHGWAETPERRPSTHPPHPEGLRMTLRNPAAARRSR